MTKFLMIALLILGSFAQAKDLYQCPMHPQIVREKPGQCPICHMDLEKVEHTHDGEKPAASAGSGKAAFTLPEARQQLIGVKVMKVEDVKLTKVLRLSARVNGGAVVAQLMEMDAGLVKGGQRATVVGPGG